MSLLKGLFLLFVAALILGLGITSATGLTGKDEYLLGLRIPLEMIQGDHWWVPYIDGLPRLKKPPFLYWIGRASYEAFGPGLLAGRGITVFFALLLLGCTAWVGKRLQGSWQTGLLAAGVLLGMMGMASESRRLMLDVPVAALSMAAFCAYLSWADRPRWSTLFIAAITLSLAILTKGPMGVIACGSGLLALWWQRPDLSRLALRRWPQHLLGMVLALALPAIWYIHVKTHYAALLTKVTQDELAARQLAHLSADPLIGIVTLSLPWAFVGVTAAWKYRQDATVRLLTLWLIISLLPFFVITTFSRYLIGSLPALALLCAVGLERASADHSFPWSRRLGSLIPALLCSLLALLLWRWQLGGWLILTAVTFVFLVFWWHSQSKAPSLILSAALLWTAAWGIAFPHLGVNAVAPEAIALAQDKNVVLFAGPQPALLPILLQKPLRQTSQLTAELTPPGTLIAFRAEDQAALETQLSALKRKAVPRLDYQSLTSAGSGVRFNREGSGREDWQAAWDQRSPAPLMSTVKLWEVLP
ncbi:MAG TPA: phospholipid carrier-dependent glycosyltransferase [Rhodocyclaceae bacterium]|jgi:4-amino-4-deoxy-L-arabinose transferase-like glycosyltransferase